MFYEDTQSEGNEALDIVDVEAAPSRRGPGAGPRRHEDRDYERGQVCAAVA